MPFINLNDFELAAECVCLITTDGCFDKVNNIFINLPEFADIWSGSCCLVVFPK